MHLPVSRAKPPPFGGGGFAKQRRRGFRPLTPGRTFPRSAALSQKTALPMITPSVIACGDATFPKGTAFVPAGRFKAPPKGVPLGKLAASETSRLKGYSPYTSINLPSAKE